MGKSPLPVRNAPSIFHSINRLWAGVAVIALALPASTAFAQQAANSNLTEGQDTVLKKIVVSATRQPKNVLDVPQSITVIGAQELNDHNVGDIQNLVRHEPGVTVDRQTSITNPWGQLNSFSIRGVGGNRVQITVDGSRVQERITDGSRDFVDPFNMQAVEIVKGPNSVLWGADALGGAVMFRTKDPSDLLKDAGKPWALEVKSGYSSFDKSWRKQVTAAYEYGDFQVLGSFGNLTASEPRLSKADPDGGTWGCPRPANFRCDRLFPADTNANSGLVKVVWTPTADHEVKLTGEFFHRDTQINQLYDSGATTGNPTLTAYRSESYIRDLEMKRSRWAIEHNWQVDAAFLDSIKWRVAYSPQRRLTDSLANRRYSNRLQTVQQLRDYSEKFFEGDVQLQSSFDLGSSHHTLTYGFDGDHTKTDYEGINNTYRSDTRTTVTAINQGFSFPRVETVRADVYLQDEITLFDDRLTITPGVRLAHYSIDPTGDESYTGLPGFAPEERSKTELLKRMGAIYKLDQTYSVYGNYGEGFKMPTSQQLFQSSDDPFSGTQVIPNPDLRPESVQSYELGVRGELDRGYFTVGGFYSEYKDFIRSLQQIPGRPTAVTSDNVEKVRLWGIEIGGEYEVYDNLTASVSAAYSRGRQQVNATSLTTAFDGAAPLTTTLGLKYEVPDYGLQFELFGTFASGREESSSAAYYLPNGYAVFDAYAKWEPKKNVEVTFGIENIFDRRYFPNTLTGYDAIQTSSAVAGVNPLELQTAPGRTFKLGATIKF